MLAARFLTTACILFLCAGASAQSTLYFPKVVSPADLSTTGYAIVNPGPAPAATTFTLRSATGQMIGSHQFSIPAGGQYAKLGSELFGAPVQAGWVQVTSPSTGLRGFFLTGDFTNFTDGADPARSASDLVLPIVTPEMQVDVVNTASQATNVSIALRSAAGAVLASSNEPINGRGFFTSDLAALFPAADLDVATHVEITGAFQIAAVATTTDFVVDPSLGVVNGLDLASSSDELNFPHVISGFLGPGGGNWLTTIGVTNLTGTQKTVAIRFTPLAGPPVTVNELLPARGGLREGADTLFGFPPGEFQDGWIQVSDLSGDPGITGFVAYADTEAGGLAVVPAQAAPLEEMLLGHIAQATGWLTGIALLNSGLTDAEVEVYAMNPDGSLIGGAVDSPAAAFTLPAGQKIARLLDQWIPAANTNGGFVYVKTTNGVEIYGLELFFLSNLALLSNVAAGSIDSGIMFIPPSSGGITLSSLAPTTVARGGSLTLSGSGFSSGNWVVFTAMGGTVAASPDSISPGALTVTVPQTAVSGPVFVDSTSGASDPLIVDVTGSSELIQLPVTVVSDTTTSGVEIYVPSPAGTLNVTGIGAGDRTMGIAGGSASVVLAQGVTTDLLIFGSGVNAAAGISVGATGDGLTFSNLTLLNGSLFVQVDVAADADPGPRTVIVTNSNLDASVLSGGIIIE